MKDMYLLKSLSKNIGLGIADSFWGIGSAIKNTVDEFTEYTKATNDALYYMQVKTFIETVDLDQEEVNQFFDENSDNQRLGIEVFKILEKTFLEKQAKLMAVVFKKYVQEEIKRNEFYQYNHIIERLNNHIIAIIDKDIEEFNKSGNVGKDFFTQDIRRIENRFSSINVKKCPELINIGFIEVETKIRDITHNHLREVTERRNVKIEQRDVYSRTLLYLKFYKDVYWEIICTE